MGYTKATAEPAAPAKSPTELVLERARALASSIDLALATDKTANKTPLQIDLLNACVQLARLEMDVATTRLSVREANVAKREKALEATT